MLNIRTPVLPVGEDARFTRSIPDYPHRRAGTALVVGTGPGFMEEHAEASRLRPGAFVMAVNKAAGFVRADAIFSIHYEHMWKWVRTHDLAWGQREMRPETHTGCRNSAGMIAWVQSKAGQYVDYLWPVANSWGSSGWAAGKCARGMGFDEVILCGVPLAQTSEPFADWRSESCVEMYREGMRLEATNEPDVAAGIKSMSGYTREILGAPDGA